MCWQHRVSGCQDGTVTLICRPSTEACITMTQYGEKKFESSLAQVTACHKFDASHCRIKLIHCKLNPLDWTVSFDLRAQRVFLTYWGLMTPYGDTILVTIGSGNGFSPVWCRTIACRVGSIHLKNWNCSSIQSLELELKLVKLNWKYCNWDWKSCELNFIYPCLIS